MLRIKQGSFQLQLHLKLIDLTIQKDIFMSQIGHFLCEQLHSAGERYYKAVFPKLLRLRRTGISVEIVDQIRAKQFMKLPVELMF